MPDVHPSCRNRWGFPGPRASASACAPRISPHILEKWPEVDWFEILSENFIDTEAGRCRSSTRSPSATRSSCTACRCRSAAPTRSTAGYLRKLKALAERARAPNGSPTTSAGPASRAGTPTTCYRCRTRRRRLRHMVVAREAVSGHPRAAAGAREPVDLRRVRGILDAGVGVPRAARRGGGLRPAARREQRLRELPQPRLRPEARTSTRSPADAWCSTTWPATPTTARTSSTRTTTTSSTRSGTSTAAPSRAPGNVATLLEWDAEHPGVRGRARGGAEGARVPPRGESRCRGRLLISSLPSHAALDAGRHRASRHGGRRGRLAGGAGGAGSRRDRGRHPALEDADLGRTRRRLPGHVPAADGRGARGGLSGRRCTFWAPTVLPISSRATSRRTLPSATRSTGSGPGFPSSCGSPGASAAGGSSPIWRGWSFS